MLVACCSWQLLLPLYNKLLPLPLLLPPLPPTPPAAWCSAGECAGVCVVDGAPGQQRDAGAGGEEGKKKLGETGGTALGERIRERGSLGERLGGREGRRGSLGMDRDERNILLGRGALL